MKNIIKSIILILLLILVGCSAHNENPYDLLHYSQNPLDYVDTEKGNELLCSPQVQSKTDSLSQNRYFSCWSDSLLSDTLATQKLLEYYQDKVTSLKQYPGIGETKLLRDSTFYNEMEVRTNLAKGFNKLRKGIMLQKAHIRVLPTNKPYFLDFKKAGEGYPFDYWQNSTIPMATPVFIYHETDNWVLISSHLCSGWVEKEKITYINNDIIESLIKPNRIAIIEDRTPIYSKTHEYLGSADIGTFFPFLFKDEVNHKATFVKKNEWGFAELIVINIPIKSGARMPIPLTQNNVAKVASKMMNQNYGWGGMYFNRDCSQLTLDLFTPFGLILPRNGNHQATHGGDYLKTTELDFKEYKEFVIANSTPFATLVRIPGHIMVYIGEENGNPLVLHNIWGLRTSSLWGKEGRYVIGKTVISSLELGEDIKGVDKKKLMLNRLSGVVNLFH